MMKLYVSSATGSIYDENTLRESFFMMRNAAPRGYDCSSDEYIRRMVEDKQELYELTPEQMMSIMVSLLAANKREQARELAVAWRA